MLFRHVATALGAHPAAVCKNLVSSKYLRVARWLSCYLWKPDDRALAVKNKQSGRTSVLLTRRRKIQTVRQSTATGS
ncbi:hypothetical protein BKA82DRAFT_1007181, partial [Pisolithus tinctorius]